MTHASHNATNSNATSNRNEENTMINQDAKVNAITATYHPTNANWPSTLRIRLVAAEKDGWVVTSDTNAVSVTRVNA